MLCLAATFEVNFRPLIQWDSRELFSKSLMKLSNLLSECEIRTSEDVRASYEDEVDFYLLSQHFAPSVLPPRLVIMPFDWNPLMLPSINYCLTPLYHHSCGVVVLSF